MPSTLIIRDSGISPIMRSWNYNDLSLTLTSTVSPQPSGGTGSYTIVSGRNLLTGTASTKYNYQIGTSMISGSGAAGVYTNYSSSNSSGASVSSGGYVTHINDGNYNIYCNFPPYLTKTVPLTLSTQVTTFTTFANWISVTLPVNMNTELSGRITGAGPTGSSPQYILLV